jgi:anti-sigma B factor antagonist
MQIDERKFGGVLVLRPRATQLNAPVVGDFKARVATIVERGDRNLILDLTEVEFVDSTALGAIVAILKMVDASGHLLLCGAGETVRAMMEVTRMTRIFPMYDDAEAARAALANAVS